MERVAFILERTGERIDCLLNPDTVVVRRSAGLRTRRTAGGLVTGTRLADDPMLATGGGRTEIDLELLFDATIAGEDVLPSGNVQDLTRPLWDLSENAVGDDEYGVPRQVRFVWGKTWNVLALVAAVAERFERFTMTGVPERSWLHLRLARVGEPIVPQAAASEAPFEEEAPSGPLILPEVPEDQITFHEVVGGEDEPAERLDEIAARYYGEPGLWRVIAVYNSVADPLQVPPPRVLRIPPLDAVRALL
jgi:Contractile injection system tube protein